MNEKNSINVINNFFWRFAERTGSQLVTFVVSIILARLLLPEYYGTIALINIFISIMQVFVDSGLSTALIQKKNVDDLDFSSVFYFNIVICIFIYIIMYALSPVIATFYNDISLTSVIRVISLTIVISGIKGVQQAYVSKNMLFKKFFFSTLCGTIASAIIGILFAYTGYGVWALVAQQLSHNIIDTLVLWMTIDWRPKKYFSFDRLRVLLSFGWKLLVSSLLETIYSNLRNLIIGKVYSPTDLSFYNQGDKLPKLIITNINTSIDSVLLPSMSNYSDDREKIKQMTRQAIKMSTYVISPLLMGLAACSEQLVSLLLTDKWLACVPFLRVFCITYIFWPVQTANLNAINAMGRSDLFLRLEIIKKIIGLILLFTTMWFGVMAMAYSLLIGSLLSQIINSWPNKKLLGYSYLNQLFDIMPSIFLSLIMGIGVYLVSFFNISQYLILLIQIIFGTVFYISISAWLKLEQYYYIYNFVVKMFKKRRD